MESLPFELLDLIFSYLGDKSLAILEQTSTHLRTSVSPRLYRAITLEDEPRSAEHFIHHFLDHRPNSKQHVRIIGVEIGSPRASGRNRSATQVDTASPLALARIVELPNISNARIGFVYIASSAWRNYDSDYWAACAQRLKLFVDAVSQCPKLNQVSVIGMRTAREERIDPQVAEKLLRGVKGFQMYFQQRGGWSEDEDSKRENWLEQREFLDDLEKVWLRNSAQLETLQLECLGGWGSMPEFRLQNINLSSLTSLELETFSFHHDSQIDAICRIRTLKRLVLNDFHILYCYVRSSSITPDSGRRQTCFWRPWAWFLTRLRDELPALRSFTGTLSTRPAALLCHCHDGWSSRYLTYSYGRNGHGPGMFINDDRAPSYPHFVRLDKMDWAALVRLQTKLGGKWKFPNGDEGEFGRRMLEDEDAKPVERYGLGHDWSEFAYWGKTVAETLALDEEDELFDMETSEERIWIRKNLKLNGVLASVGECRPECDWPV